MISAEFPPIETMQKQLQLGTEEELRDLFKDFFGLIFVPPRQDLIIPDLEEITVDKIRQALGDHYTEGPWKRHVSYLHRFLSFEAIGDQWGNDHENRVEWVFNVARYLRKEGLREPKLKNAADLFLRFERGDNKFRLGSLVNVRDTVYLMNMYRAPAFTVASLRIEEIRTELQQVFDGKLTGQKYHEISSLDTKLSIIGVFEDRVSEVLTMLLQK